MLHGGIFDHGWKIWAVLRNRRGWSSGFSTNVGTIPNQRASEWGLPTLKRTNTSRFAALSARGEGGCSSAARRIAVAFAASRPHGRLLQWHSRQVKAWPRLGKKYLLDEYSHKGWNLYNLVFFFWVGGRGFVGYGFYTYGFLLLEDLLGKGLHDFPVQHAACVRPALPKPCAC